MLYIAFFFPVSLKVVSKKCFFAVYVFLGNHMALIDMMMTMQALQLFDQGEYMVIYVDMMTYSVKEAQKYLWSK